MAILAMTCFMFAFETQGRHQRRLRALGLLASLIQVVMWL